VTNNRQRMDYPEYRRLGLPISSAPVESTIKQMNRRVKGSEKFWLEGGRRGDPAIAGRPVEPGRSLDVELAASPEAPPCRRLRPPRPGHMRPQERNAPERRGRLAWPSARG